MHLLLWIAMFAITFTATVCQPQHTYVQAEKALHDARMQANMLEKYMNKFQHHDVTELSDWQGVWLQNKYANLTPGLVISTMAAKKDNNSSVVAISEQCANQSLYVINSFPEIWTLRMFDAWGKPESGIFESNLKWIGKYHECITAQSNKTGQPNVLDFTGKYCNLVIPEEIDISPGPKQKIEIWLGLCVPEACSNYDVSAIVDEVYLKISPQSKPAYALCHEKNVPLSAGAIVTLAVYGVIIGICILSTLYDYISQRILRQMEEKITDQVENDLGNGAPAEGSKHLLLPKTQIANSQQKGLFVKLLLCFSFYTNGCKLLGTDQPAGSLQCVHGIRFLSMTWVILGHTVVFGTTTISNMAELLQWLQRQSFQVILNATVSVDSFFMVSGLLTAYLFLINLERKNVNVLEFLISVPIMYLHRYIRLTPAYGLMIMFYVYLTFYMYEGPFWGQQVHVDPNCNTGWWTNLLYINNIVNGDKQCAGWGWYLANDFQFFLLSPFIIYLIYRFERIGVTVAVSLVLFSCAAAVAASSVNNLQIGGLGGTAHFMSLYYGAPWARYQTFGVGIVFGYLIWKYKNSMQLHWAVNLLLWAASAALCLVVLYAPFDAETIKHKPTNAENAAYNGLGRTAWAIGLGWVVLACTTGHGGWVNEFLSWKGFIPLSRMTYCAYLMHPVVMTIVFGGLKNAIQIDELQVICLFVTFVFTSYAVAFVFSLLFEAPFMNIDKHFITGKLSKKSRG